MKTRVISGSVIGILFLTAAFFGGWYLYFLMLLASLIGLFEFYKAFDSEKSPLAIVGYIATTVVFICSKLSLEPPQKAMAIVFVLVAMFIAIMTIYVFSFDKFKASDIMVAFFGVVYVGVMLSYVVQIRDLPYGIFFIWCIFLGSWVNDTCAYFTGYFIGRRKLAPTLSPKKTVEGAIGGIVGATVVGLIFGIIVHFASPSSVNMILFGVLTGLIGSFFGIIGDLAASAIKRQRGVKDYGNLIPGHGGILDRFDSVIFTAPAVYWTAVFILHITLC